MIGMNMQHRLQTYLTGRLFTVISALASYSIPARVILLLLDEKAGFKRLAMRIESSIVVDRCDVNR